LQIDNKALLAHLAGRGTLVVPSSQRAAAVRFAHARAALAGGERIWETPDVLPWNAWLQREAARGAGRASRAWHLNPAEEWWLWREAVREACAGSSLLQPESLAAPVRNAAALLEEWGIALRSAPTEEAEVLLQARALFGARCASLGAVPPGVAALPPPVDGPLLTLAGFDALGPARRSALKARAARFHIPVALAPAPTVHWAAHDTEDELLAAALWARAQLERDPAARVLILLPDLDQRSAALHSALARCLAPEALLRGESSEPLYAFEGGTPLAEVPLIRTALSVLRLASSTLDFEEFAALLRSPFLAAADRITRARLELWLRERPIVPFGIQELGVLAEALPPGAEQALLRHWRRLLALPLHARDSTGSWARQFATLLEHCGWPGPPPLGSDAEQARARFVELLGELADLGPVSGSLSASAALALLAERAVHTGFEPAREDVPVTVSAVLSDPLVRYAGIWVAGLSAEHWPAPPAPDPFIPTALQRQAGLPRASVAGQHALAQTHLARWQACAGELILSWPRHDQDLELAPSPLLGGFSSTKAPAAYAAVDPLTAFWQAQEPPRRLPEPATPIWPAIRPLPGGTRALELQSQCPFRAFAEQRLGARALAEPSPGLDARSRGQLLHDALERLWQVLHTLATLQSYTPAALQELIQEHVALAGEALQRQGAIPADVGLWRQELERTTGLIAQLLEMERTREDFIVEALEQSVALSLGEAQLRLRLDRLDRFVDGSVAVIDYKSGNAQRFEADAARPQHPQLLAYAIAAGPALAAVASVHVQSSGIRWRGAADRAGRVPGLAGPKSGEAPLAEQRTRWQQRLTELAREFLAGNAAVQPLEGACRYCHLPLLCRIDALNCGDDAEASDTPGPERASER
jgi:probable DNA repair protein